MIFFENSSKIDQALFNSHFYQSTFY